MDMKTSVDEARDVQTVAPKLQIKGIKEGLLVVLGEGEWTALRQLLLDHVDKQADFLQGGRLALDVGNQVLKAMDLGGLRNALSERGLSLWAVLSNSPTTVQTAQTLGLETEISRPKRFSVDESFDAALHGVQDAVLISKTLRSGNRLEYPGHIIVIGDVNPGAELVAGGNIVVWGHLRGLVHAGAQGDEQAVVCALDLHPTQLRIADQIAITPKRKGKPQPEKAHLKNNKVIAEQWSP